MTDIKKTGVTLTPRLKSSEHPLQGKKYKWYYYVIDTYLVLKHLMFPLTMVFIGIAAFCILSPGTDMMKILGDEPSFIFHLFMAIFTSWWSAVIWYGSRVVLHYSHIEYINLNFNISVQKWLPRILGFSTLLVFIFGIINAKGEHAAGIALLYFVIALVLFLFYIFRRKIFEKRLSFEDFNPGALEFKFSEFIKRWWLIDISFILFLIIFILILIFPVSFPRLLSPLGIIITAFAGWSILGLIIKIIDKVKFMPVLATLIFLAVVFSRFNFVNVIPTGLEKNNIEIVDYFNQWYEDRELNDTDPIFIVTAEGGASRSAYWTGRILTEIQQRNPDFYDHIFTLTSVSGGSLGTSTYFVLMESLKNDSSFKAIHIADTAKYLLSRDFLAPVSAGMLYPNLFQLFIPVRFKSFSRARYLEKGWVENWEQLSDFDFRRTYNSYWLQSNHAPPLLVLNTTRVESGKRAVISYARFNKDLCDLEDILHIDSVDANFTMPNAVSSSAAFPYISPSARIRKTDGSFWGNVVDGGYFENSSVYTAIDIYNHIKESEYFKRDNIYFLVIRAFPDGADFEPNVYINEAVDPLRAILKTRGARSPHSNIMLSNIVNPDHIIKIQLNKGSQVPVNWYLSEKAIKTMENELDKNENQITTVLEILNN